MGFCTPRRTLIIIKVVESLGSVGTKLEQELEGNKWRRKLRLLAFMSMRGRLDRDSLLATARSAYGLLAFE